MCSSIVRMHNLGQREGACLVHVLEKGCDLEQVAHNHRIRHHDESLGSESQLEDAPALDEPAHLAYHHCWLYSQYTQNRHGACAFLTESERVQISIVWSFVFFNPTVGAADIGARCKYVAGMSWSRLDAMRHTKWSGPYKKCLPADAICVCIRGGIADAPSRASAQSYDSCSSL